MSEIPKDIYEAAWAAYKEGEYDHGARMHHIALAILSERERCASLAESSGIWNAVTGPGHYAPVNGSPQEWEGSSGSDIAKAIRGTS